MTIGRSLWLRRSSLDLGFLELDVLAHDGIILVEAHLLGRVARILLRHVKEAGIGRTDELDLDGGRLRHDRVPCFDSERGAQAPPKNKAASPPLAAIPLPSDTRKVKPHATGAS